MKHQKIIRVDLEHIYILETITETVDNSEKLSVCNSKHTFKSSYETIDNNENLSVCNSKHTFKSSYETIDNNENLSICYSNIYCIDGRLKYLTTENEKLPYVNLWPNYQRWIPDILLFNNDDELYNYVQNLQDIENIELAAYGDMVHAHNIGHGLLDCLYPVYLALVKFNYINDDFKFIVPIFIHKEIMMYDIIKKFSGFDILEFSTVKKLHISKLISGSGVAGNSAVNKDCKLYGSVFNGIYNFRKRMLNRYNILENISINDKLNIVIIDNKRYSEYERNILKEIVLHYSDIFNIKYIYWNTYSSFEEQLREISNADIQITGPGTGMLYIPFLKNNSVNINLGFMEHLPGRSNTTIENSTKSFIVPSWMEQSICSGCEHVNTIYYDRYNYNNIEFLPMLDIINNAVSIIKGDIKLDTNLNTDALIFKEYCNSVDNYKEICNQLMKYFFYCDTNNFVNEHPNIAPNNIININLLREIKRKYNYGDKYLIIP